MNEYLDSLVQLQALNELVDLTRAVLEHLVVLVNLPMRF
jgi:hypothetical protein